MNLELFSPAEARAGPVVDAPRTAMGAYEALLAGGQTLPRIAGAMCRHGGLRLSDLVAAADVNANALRAGQLIAAAGLGEVGVVARGSAEYPEPLRDAADIVLLYYLGSWDLLATRCVAMVGTRQPSAAGLARTAEWAARLVADGFTIVSGLARGIDTCAHQAALAAGGRAIAVLGTPLSVVYPPENQALQHRIAHQQLLLSHVPFVRYANQPLRANREFFLQRNAVITALSEATLVVEAGDRSGALVAARHALRQGRRLLIPDSCRDDVSLHWPGKFLTQGALGVKDYADIRRQLA
jgi:DNA processing protein